MIKFDIFKINLSIVKQMNMRRGAEEELSNWAISIGPKTILKDSALSRSPH